MATQTDVQQLIQGLTPSGVNNGNPNTAYNSPMPPVMDAFGNWSAPQVSRAANVTLNRGLPQALPQATPTRVGFLPPLPPLNLNPNWATPRPPVVTTPPPVVDPVVPPVVAPPVPPLPPLPGSGVGAGTGQGGWMGGDIRDIQDTATFNGIGATNGMNLINSGQFGSGSGGTSGNFNLQNFLDSNPWVASRFGINNDNSMDWQQIFDLLSEPLIQGNLYNSQTNTWNLGNVAGGVLGGPVALLNKLFGNVLNPDQDRNQIMNEVAEAIRGDRLQVRNDAQDYLSNVGIDIGQAGWRENFGDLGSLANLTAANPSTNPQFDSTILDSVTEALGSGGWLGGGAGGGLIGGTAGRPIGGAVNVSGGAAGYNNGAGAGTGFGTQQIWNDAWGDVAAGFGIGATSAGSAGSIALSDAMRQNRLNRV